jgi:outer membrane protein OmpA-like peptidoglycan-associated protein/tetratricopeptide (TPR) repeat protein
MKLKNTFITVLLILSATFSNAQNNEMEKGNDMFNRYSFSLAIDIYTKVAEEGYESAELFEKIGDSYYFIGNLKEASKWYKKLIALNEEIEPEYYFRYGLSLKSIGDYQKADEMMAKFNKLVPKENRALLSASDQDYLTKINKNSNRYTIELLTVNSKASDYGAAFYGTELVFASARDAGFVSRKRHTWNNEMFTDLYVGKIEEQGQVSNSTKFSSKLNTKFHESTVTFTCDGKTIYFTRNNFMNSKRRGDSKGITRLKVYRSKLDEQGNWGNEEELPFNSDEYSVAHPTLSNDGKLLYFASDMPGTLGASDIFKVVIHSDGTFGEPTNLGPEINTEARESFPFVSKLNNLYFASNGRPGLGGLDVFMANLDKDNKVIEVKNVGKPVNSSEDDFSFIVNDVTKMGYFSSNRAGGIGSDDIYSLKELPLEKAVLKSIIVIVRDKSTNELLDGAKVSLANYGNKPEFESSTNIEGKVGFDAGAEKEYFVKVSKEGYSTAEKIIAMDSNEIVITLDKNFASGNINDDLALKLSLNAIYFDIDKWNIKQGAEIELAKIIAAMNKYPKLKVEIRSHTDNRGSADYNLALSQKRAKATMDFLISKGVEKDRLTAKGFGENSPLIDCTGSLNCDEAMRQKNRRSEFIIVE